MKMNQEKHNLVDKVCITCGASYKCWPYRATISLTCSRACAYKAIREKKILNPGHFKLGRKGTEPWNKGKKCPEISAFLTGRKHKESSKEKMRLAKLSNPTMYWLGKKRPFETIQRMAKGHVGLRKGALNNNWKGGVTPINEKLRKSYKTKNWRRKVFERDGYACVFGGKAHGNNLQADHIKTWADHPKLRFVVSNGRTLCVNCHRKTPTWGNRNKKQNEKTT